MTVCYEERVPGRASVRDDLLKFLDVPLPLPSNRARSVVPNSDEDVPTIDEARSLSDATGVQPRSNDRHIILHYHIFKNAGTSLDRTLERNLGSRWAPLEAERGSRLPQDELVEYVRSHPSVAAVSSHTMAPFRADPAGLTLISIVFLRHPLDRARSIWEFHRRRPDNVPLAAMAKRLDLAEYLELGLERGEGGDASVAGHQARWLGRDGSGPSLADRARDTLSGISVVGLVEEYPRSISRLQRAAEPWFPELRLRALRVNDRPVPLAQKLLRFVGREESLDDRLHRLKRRIGADLYHRLEVANQDDMILWEEVRTTYRRDN